MGNGDLPGESQLERAEKRTPRSGSCRADLSKETNRETYGGVPKKKKGSYPNHSGGLGQNRQCTLPSDRPISRGKKPRSR